MSPAYDLYKAFSITELRVNEILSERNSRGKDKPNFDLRFATCKWVAKNLDHIVENWIPPSYPRQLVGGAKHDPFTIVALVFSAIAIILTAGTACGVRYKQQQGTLARTAQIEFLVLLLAGLLFVSIGSLLLALPPSKGVCVGSIWTINIGYTTQLVPTIIRVSAIIKIVRASKKFKIVTVDKTELLTRSIGECNQAVSHRNMF